MARENGKLLSYLRAQLKFTAAEWTQLTNADKETLKAWADAEMTALGL